MSADIQNDLFAGGGDTARLMRARDWSQTPFGPVDSWPQSLRSGLSICFNSSFPIALDWEPLLFYGAWSPISGSKHPWVWAGQASR